MLRVALAIMLACSTRIACGAPAPTADLVLAIGTPASSAATTVAADLSVQEWHIDAQGSLRQQAPLSADLSSPLGSVWKLFVYDYLVSQKIDEKPYECRGQQRDEVYCCNLGQAITRDEALVKSCGLYFDLERLGITSGKWGKYWQSQHAPAWLLSLEKMQPETEVSVQSLLNVLARLPAQTDARRVLLDRVLLQNPLASSPHSSAALVAQLGSNLRVKTWSWHSPKNKDQRLGGFAGWLQNGTPIWASAAGTSEQVLQQYAAALDKTLPKTESTDAVECVEIALFDRYPLLRVDDANGKSIASSGALNGRYTVYFQNGNQVAIESRSDIYLMLPNANSLAHTNTKQAAPDIASAGSQVAAPRLIARLPREEYVARVLDREASAQPTEAAKALAIVARTYLLQNAARVGECLQINDSSHHQRVAPRPATTDSRSVTQWTADLVIAGAVVHYHQNEADTHQLSWAQAKELAGQGWRYDAILASVFPRGNLARWGNPVVTCQPLPTAEKWLLKQLPLWRERLYAETGYEETRQFGVCKLQAGRPHIDRQRRQIYVRSLQTQQDRLDITHEYLHLAFDSHPSGQDENFVESMARRLLLE